jgi:trimethylamine--corrinoid protein Co-methyltransferase
VEQAGADVSEHASGSIGICLWIWCRRFRLNLPSTRNPERSVRIGGKNTIFVPMYGAPYVRDLDNNRRYGTLEDLQNFHKLAYMAPALHSSSSIICEPMEIAVPKRHLHIIHSALKHSDKPFMGIVTSKDRAEDTMAMAGIVFGDGSFGQSGSRVDHQLQLAAGLGRDHAGRHEVYARTTSR